MTRARFANSLAFLGEETQCAIVATHFQEEGEVMGRITTIGEFGKALREVRKKRGLTQDELAMSVGATRKLISELENGKREVSLGTALMAAHEIGLDIKAEFRK